jgi:hypothetical protein
VLLATAVVAVPDAPDPVDPVVADAGGGLTLNWVPVTTVT